MRFSVLLLVLSGLAASAQSRNYNNCKVYRFTLSDTSDFKYLQELKNDNDYDFFTSLNNVGLPTDVMVCPSAQPSFENYLQQRIIPYRIVNENVERSLREEYMRRSGRPRSHNRKITFNQYHSLDEIYNYLDQLSKTFSDIVSLSSIGKTHEGRDIKVVRITSTSGQNNIPKPIIFVEGGIHAREWISPATVLYLIQQLTENKANKDLIQDVEWIILPLLNPDGYKFSWESAKNRLWRKNRAKGKKCPGVDLNRNFGYYWGGKGSSDDPCDEVYRGTAAFSENESLSLRDFLTTLNNVKVFYAVHSFGQFILHPWGYDYNLTIENKEQLQEVGNLMKDAIFAVNGTQYEVGGSADTLGPAAGGSDDWAKSIGIDLAYTYELPPSSSGSDGFILDPERILGAVTETFAGLKALHDYIVAKYVNL